MHSVTKKIDALINKLPAPLSGNIDVMCYGYILSKSFSFMKSGPVDYSGLDAFGEPYNLSNLDLKRLKINCLQLTEGKGILMEDPIVINSVPEVYALTRLFHFKVDRRKSSYSSDAIIDCVKISHSILSNHQSKQQMNINLFFKIQR